MLIRTGQSGVTLIEAMVAIAIMAILLSMSAPGVESWMHNSQVRTAAESVSSGLQLARAEAARINDPAGVTFTLTGNDWSVTSSVAGVSSVIQSRSGKEGTSNVAISSTQSTVTFNGAGRICSANACSASCCPPAADITFDVTNPKAGACATTTSAGVRCLRVIVKSGGQIRMCDPALSLAANPQGCS